ncbi:MAG: YihY family inner membrane protein [Spirochaetes bacterium]|nr:YihY family inner membrane protein [Spirochaetota bacterium]MBN2770481.1 YihY family inner membrane protein [Spirochaetota bacterium]
MAIKKISKKRTSSKKLKNKDISKKSIKKSKKNILKKSVDLILKFLKNITDEEYITDITYGRISRAIISIIKVFIASFRKFIDDDCMTKATAITYTTLVSLIPTLMVIMTVVSMFMYKGVEAQKDEIFDQITRFLAEYNLQRLNITPLLNAISGLLDNSKRIGGIGAVVLIFSATAILRTIEQALNKIWKIKKQRPFFNKFIYYWAALTLGPLMLFVGTTLATQLSASFSEPDYNALLQNNGKYWIVGSKATAGYKISPLAPLIPVSLSTIDFENQRNYNFSHDDGEFIIDNTIIIDENLFKKYSFNDINIIGSQIIICGDNGILLSSTNYGASWKITKLSFFNLRKIHMFDSSRGIILSDQGTLLKTDDGGINWNLLSIPNISSNLHDVAFNDNYGIVVADNGFILESFDGGDSWIAMQLNKARLQNDFVALNAVAIKGSSILIAGSGGMILKSEDRGKTFSSRHYKNDDYSAVFLEDNSNYYIASRKGKLIYTQDDGANFEILLKNSKKINTIIASSDQIILSGKTGLLLFTNDKGFNWSGNLNRSILFYLLNFVAPFAVIWVLFLLMYLVMPNTRIPFHAASIGASFTSAVWVGFIYIFIIYIKSFANGTFAIYGALAAFPLTLLLIYASNNIMLFGAEIAYTLMYPTTYRNLKRKIAIRDYIQVINGVKILYYIFNKFESGKGGSDHQEILKLCSNNITETDYYIDLFKSKKLILMTDNSYIPATASVNIQIATIVEMIHNFTFDSSSAHNDPVKRHLGSKFKKMSQSFNTILGKQTLADLINDKG